MKAIVFSDTHIHPFAQCATLDENGYNERLLDGVEALMLVRKYAEDNSIRLAFFCGDLFQHRDSLPTEALVFVQREIMKWAEVGITIVGIAGNHDRLSRDVATIDAAGNVGRPLPGYGYCEVGGLLVYGLDWVPGAKELKTYLRALEKCKDSGRVLLLHATVHGSLQGSERKLIRAKSLLKLKDLPTDAFDWIFVGHIHHHQKLAKNVIVPGALMQHNFGDATGVRGFGVVDFDAGTYEHIHLPEIPRFHVLPYDETPDEYLMKSHVRIVFPTGYKRKGAYDFCLKFKDEHGSRTVVPEFESDANVVPQVTEVETASFQDTVDDYVATEKKGKRVARIGKKIVAEATDA